MNSFLPCRISMLIMSTSGIFRGILNVAWKYKAIFVSPNLKMTIILLHPCIWVHSLYSQRASTDIGSDKKTILKFLPVVGQLKRERGRQFRLWSQCCVLIRGAA